jgi:hypothetical protein
MWHLHWRADARRPCAGDGVSTTSTTSYAEERPGRRSRGAFQHARCDTPDAAKAADVPESVRVRGR